MCYTSLVLIMGKEKQNIDIKLKILYNNGME